MAKLCKNLTGPAQHGVYWFACLKLPEGFARGAGEGWEWTLEGNEAEKNAVQVEENLFAYGQFWMPEGE